MLNQLVEQNPEGARAVAKGMLAGLTRNETTAATHGSAPVAVPTASHVSVPVEPAPKASQPTTTRRGHSPQRR